jgi:hypothetical protein
MLLKELVKDPAVVATLYGARRADPGSRDLAAPPGRRRWCWDLDCRDPLTIEGVRTSIWRRGAAL